MELSAMRVRVTRAVLQSQFRIEFGPSPVEPGTFVRESQIYPLFNQESKVDDFKDGEVVIIYSSSPFKLISSFKNSRLTEKLEQSLFYSSGYATVIGFVSSTKEVDAILKVADPFYEFSERWTVRDSLITQHPPVASPSFEPQSTTNLLLLPEDIIQGAEDSEKVILKDIYDVITQLAAKVAIVGEPFVAVLESVCCQTNDLALQIIYIEGKISGPRFKLLSQKYAGADDDESIDAVVTDFDGIHRKNPVKAVENLQTLRDELVQIRACLKYYYRQGFTCFPPLLQTDHPVGFDSLFGYNACLWGLQGLFEHIQKANESIQTFDSFLQKLGDESFKLKRPKNIRSNSRRYIEWIESVSNKSDLIHRDRAPDTSSKFQKPLSYFSSRLGFKATDISITASIESISYCDRPAWHLATLFHEYTHLFVAPIFGELRNSEAEEETLFEKYPEFYDPSNRNDSELTPYEIFKLSFWHTSFILKQIDSQNYASSDQSTFAREFSEVKKAVDRTARDSEEIVVQTLEYSYFYQGLPDVYLKSIWSSWLSLPATYIHKRQYLLRSLLAISVDLKGDNDTRFGQAIDILTKSISTLETDGYVRLGAVQEINSYINDANVKNTLRRYFFDLIEFADLSAQFLVDPQLRSRMFQDREVLWEDGEYFYAFSNLEYCSDVIESPVRFLIDKLKETLKCSEPDGACLRQRGEQHSLWIFHVIGATLKEDTDP